MNENVFLLDNYTISDLLTIFELEELDEENLLTKTVELLENTNDNETKDFINSAAEKLYLYMEQNKQNLNIKKTYSYDSNNEELTNNPFNKQISKWFKNIYLKQSDEKQLDKITSRENKIRSFDNEHEVLKQEKLGIENNYNVPIIQGTLNPILKNINTLKINIDSQYRPTLSYSSSIFTFNLTETIHNALSISLKSYEIPFTWYNISSRLNNNYFSINNTCISIDDGYYTKQQLISALDAKLKSTNTGNGATLNEINGKVTLVEIKGNITFFDPLNTSNCSKFNCGSIQTGSGKSITENFNLGYILGFRENIYNKEEGQQTLTITSEAVLNIHTTKYILIYLDDFNKNQLNNGLIGVDNDEKTLNLPNYFNNDLKNSCPNELFEYFKTPIVERSAPRKITQAQIYTINEITKNRKTRTNYRYKTPNNSNILAKIPVNYASNKLGDLLIENKVNETFERRYFGPVNIDKMKVILLDDKANVLDLNGNDWSFTLNVKYLYQF